MQFDYFMPSKLYFGEGSLNKLAKVKLPGTKAIIITGGTSTTKLGYVERVQNLLKENGCDSVVYSSVKPNPTTTNVADCVKLIKENGCDFVIGLGGGSSIDTSKATAVSATNEGDYWDYIGTADKKPKKIENDPLPIIAITTTAGTGTEADPWTVVTHEETYAKIGFGYDKTYPTFSIIDPELMYSVPSKLTAYQGFDALFHATEGYIATCANPISEMFSLKSISLIGKSLARAVNDGNDKEARMDVAIANTLSGFVESTSSCTSEHSIEHAMSAYHTKLEHGAGLIMISLEYYKAFLNDCPEKLVDMAKALGMENATKAEDFITVLAKLQKDCHVDNLKMSDYGIDNTNFMKYAENAVLNMGGLFAVDPRKLSLEETAAIMEKSYR